MIFTGIELPARAAWVLPKTRPKSSFSILRCNGLRITCWPPPNNKIVKHHASIT
jgi:hypothetical protein